MLDFAVHLVLHLQDILPHLNALLGDRMEHSCASLWKFLNACEDTRRPAKPRRNCGKDGDPLDPFPVFWCLGLLILRFRSQVAAERLELSSSIGQQLE